MTAQLGEQRLFQQPVAGWGVVASVFIALSSALGIGIAWADWNAYLVNRDLTGDPATASDIASAVALAQAGALILAVTAFIIWLYRARTNAEILSDAPHRRTVRWVGWSWFTPIVNFWFPFQVVSDIWKASKPDRRGSRVLGLWWTCWVISLLAEIIGDLIIAAQAETRLAELKGYAIVAVLSQGFLVLAGAFIIIAVRQISQWQGSPRPE
jgi:hypothetical protein